MLKLIPAVKELRARDGKVTKRSVAPVDGISDARLQKALAKLPVAPDGLALSLCIGKDESEEYTLTLDAERVSITAGGARGAFYAIQTLRQIFENDDVPCLTIHDKPDFSYRGFYHDVTRGKIATVKTIKNLVDTMARFKMNALQLYVEHVFEFEECRDLIDKTGYLTGAEIEEIDAYCKENFIDFQPSLSTFGHLFELVQQEKYQHLRVLKNFEEDACRWSDRMMHHTIDPSAPESIEIVKHLIDQYAPHFTSKFFNVCCDETFDLKSSFPSEVEGKLYIDFVKKIIAHTKAKGKTAMMWADILLQHPEYIGEIPDDVIFLNWTYRADPLEEGVAKLAEMGRKQIVCPGTTSWSRFCERVDREEPNITRLADYGYKHGALGVLNTNWGDWGNPASLETVAYGLVLGAAKSWAIDTAPGDALDAAVNALLYKNPDAMRCLRRMSAAHNGVDWVKIMRAAHNRRAGIAYEAPITKEDVATAQDAYRELSAALGAQDWREGDFKAEMLLAAEGICVLAELGAKLADVKVKRLTDTKAFLARYREKWLEKNKESELTRIEDALLYAESV